MNIGTITQNVNTVTIGDGVVAAAPVRNLTLFYQGSSQNLETRQLRFVATKEGNGGNPFEVTVTVNRDLTGRTVTIDGSSTNVDSVAVVVAGSTTQLIVQIRLPNSQPVANIALNISPVLPSAGFTGTAEFTRITGPFDAPPQITWGSGPF